MQVALALTYFVGEHIVENHAAYKRASVVFVVVKFSRAAESDRKDGSGGFRRLIRPFRINEILGGLSGQRHECAAVGDKTG